MKKELKKTKKVKNNLVKINVLLISIIGLILVGLIVGVVFLSNPDRELEVGAEIQEVLIDETGENVFIKLSGGLDDGEIEEVKFVFEDDLGNEYIYSTSEGVQEISVPIKKGFWNWLKSKKFKGTFDYEIKSEDVGVDDFGNIKKVGVVFKYRTDEGEEVETDVLDTTEKVVTSGGGGSGGGGGSSGGTPVPTPTCINDAGCSAEGLFCSNEIPHECNVGGDGCLDRVEGNSCQSNLNDLSGYLNDGVVVGDVSVTSEGKFNEGFVFDGNGDYIRVGDTSELDINDEITIGAWVYADANDAYRYVVSKAHTSSGPLYLVYGLGYYDYTRKIRFVISSDSVQYSVNTPNVIEPNQWHYVVGTYSNTNNNLSIYLDGILVDTTHTNAGQIDDNDMDVLIGGYEYQNTESWEGKLDEVGIWDVRLSESEILELYNSLGVDVGLVLYYSFDDTGGCVEGLGCTEVISCISDSECDSYTDVCGVGKCNLENNKCYVEFSDVTVMCRASVGECDVEDYCSGGSVGCVDGFNDSGVVCSSGVCDGDGGCVECISSLDCNGNEACLDNVCRGDYLINPATDFEYLGAFLLPDEDYGSGSRFNYGGYGMTYYPEGDVDSSDDGYNGSLYIIGEVHNVSEVTIPIPIISPTKSYSDLNRATLLQNFTDITNGSRYSYVSLRDIEYYSKQGNQVEDKLHWAMYDYYVPQEHYLSGWSNLNFSNLSVDGNWKLGNVPLGAVGEYLFEIPQSWADQYTPGKYLANGRKRPGQGGGSWGNSLYAFGPWNDGNPPANGTVLNAMTLLYYADINQGYIADSGFSFGDDWFGGAWLTMEDKQAVIFSGRRAIRNFENGLEYYGIPLLDHASAQGGKGYYSNPYYYAILFYDPKDLADVSLGVKQSYEPRPYAVFNPSKYMFRPESGSRKTILGGVAYDRNNSLLYVIQLLTEGYYPRRPIIHVWKVNNNPGVFDTTLPTAPENLRVESVTSNSINISWDVATDDSEVSGYLVYRNFYPREIVADLNYVDNEVSPNTNYTYTVSAFDVMNNFGPQSLPLNVLTGEGVDNKVPYIRYKRIKNITSTSAIIQWETDEPTTSEVFYYFNPYDLSENYTFSNLILTKYHEAHLDNLPSNNWIFYRLISNDSSGNVLTWVDSLANFYTLDNVPENNQAPVLNSIGNKQLTYGETIEIDIFGSDPEGNRVNFMASNLPEGSLFNARTYPIMYGNSSWFGWTPRFDQAGTYDITFAVSDGDLSDREVVTITVLDGVLLSPLESQGGFFSNLTQFFKNIFGLVAQILGSGKGVTGNVVREVNETQV